MFPRHTTQRASSSCGPSLGSIATSLACVQSTRRCERCPRCPEHPPPPLYNGPEGNVNVATEVSSYPLIRVRDALRASEVGRSARVQGCVRTKRQSKAGVTFVELNDGS